MSIEDSRTPAARSARLPDVARLGWEAQPETGAAAAGPGAVSLAALWRAAAKHARLIGVCVVVGLTLATVATLLTPPVYTAQAVIQIDREQAKIVSSEEQTPVDNLGEEFFQTQYGLLRSRALSIRVAQTLGLEQDRQFLDQMAGRAGQKARPLTADERTDRVVDTLQTHEGVIPERGSRLVAVSFASPDAALSAKVANAFADGFITEAFERRFESASYARDFLEKRLAQVKAKLEESERDLVAYAAEKQIIQLPTSGQTNANDTGPSLAAANLESFNTALAAARTDRIRAEQKWRQASSAGGDGLTEILQSPTFQTLSQEHAKLVAEYQDKLKIFKPDYPELVQLKARIDETSRQMDLEAGQIRDSLRSQYEAALANERALQGQVNGLKGDVLDQRGRSIRYTILQREVDTNRSLYDGLLQRYKEVGVAGGVAANNISIVDRAEPPRRPSEPRPLVNLLFGALAGLALGVLTAFLREALDQAIRAPADLETGLGMSVLGATPILAKDVDIRQALDDGRSHLAEAYHSLRSALQFSTVDGFPKSLMVTSPWPGGGKTTTSFAIARYVARLGFRVLLIDGDLRNPSLRELVDADDAVGLSNLLTGAAALKEAMQPTAFPNLFVITSGPLAPNPAELLGGPRLQLLIAQARPAFDMIVVDGPPIMGLADAPLIGAVVAGCLLVVESGKTTRAQVRESLRRLSMAGAHVLGAVLTKHRAPRTGFGYGEEYGYGYGYGYGYDYGHGKNGAAEPPPTGVRGAVARLRGAADRARRLIRP